MIRFFFRFLSVLALAVAVIMAVLDATRSVAADALVLTPLASSWQAVSPETFLGTQNSIEQLGLPFLWNPVATTIIALPGFAVFLGLSLLFYSIGRRPERRPGRLRHVSG